MITASTFAHKRVALFGLGGSGLATALSLKAGGAVLTAWDDNPDQVATAAEHGIPTADLRGIDWRETDTLVLSPGVPLTHPKPHWSAELALSNGVEIIGDVEVFVRERRAHAEASPFIAITGTNGKSTTTALIAHLLASAGRDVQMGGNIGTAILTLAPPSSSRVHVVECSSFQIDLAPSLDPTAGILLNLTPDHLDRHGDMDRYAAIKERLVARSDLAIVGVDDVYCAAIASRIEAAGGRVSRISKQVPVNNGIHAEGTRLILVEDGERTVFTDLDGISTLCGAHNAQNAAAAVAAVRTTGISDAAIRAGLASFPGLQHRMQPVGRKGRVTFVNDSKATNADAAAPALASFPRIYWILGGLPKDGGVASLEPLFDHIAKAYLIGEAAAGFAATLGGRVAFEIAGTLDRAVAHAARDAAEDDDPRPVVLLSPACASFDQFRNFEVRGEAFVALVSHIDGIEMLVQAPSKGAQHG